ncbi:MAG: DUF86 domain-containing protein [Spirochaetales bacterium]|nr:DUF86 domain-containing protein [Leptospiraceae bacterium]MCP5483083.1 DUF86 domain-containing protein [Spirochaetales bacterium]MCP5486109.1 DUF86 domain-containing protein [Spirochaetales bacterium]
MPLDPDVVLRLLAQGRRHIEILRTYQKMPRPEFRSEAGRMLAVLHGLQITIQCLIDLALHVSAALGEMRIETYADAARALVDLEVLSAGQGETMRAMVGLRNLIVHAYAAIDEERILSLLDSGLDDLAGLLDAMERDLKKRGAF